MSQLWTRVIHINCWKYCNSGPIVWLHLEFLFHGFWLSSRFSITPEMTHLKSHFKGKLLHKCHCIVCEMHRSNVLTKFCLFKETHRVKLCTAWELHWSLHTSSDQPESWRSPGTVAPQRDMDQTERLEVLRAPAMHKWNVWMDGNKDRIYILVALILSAQNSPDMWVLVWVPLRSCCCPH